MLAEIWFESNHRIFHDKARGWTETVDTAKRNVATWCSLNKEFFECSIQDSSLNPFNVLISLHSSEAQDTQAC